MCLVALLWAQPLVGTAAWGYNLVCSRRKSVDVLLVLRAASGFRVKLSTAAGLHERECLVGASRIIGPVDRVFMAVGCKDSYGLP